jgi:ribonuclease R
VRFVLDESGKPLGVVRKQRIETNMLIEDFMLLANREVARYVADLAAKVEGSRRAFLYRIHDTPKADRIEELSIYLKAIGYELKKKGSQGLSARDINSLFAKIAGKPEEQLIKTATIRSMAKAIYSTKNIGHFGLSFEYYTHFTSPIRRYPDMLVHRVLASHAHREPMSKEEFDALEKLCMHSSEQEAKAVAAERESIRYKQVEYMLPHIGKEFDAIVSGVADWGIYVEEKETKSDGLVRVRNLEGDFFKSDKKTYSMRGARTGKTYSLGDAVRVKLIAADLATRTLEFTIV